MSERGSACFGGILYNGGAEVRNSTRIERKRTVARVDSKDRSKLLSTPQPFRKGNNLQIGFLASGPRAYIASLLLT